MLFLKFGYCCNGTLLHTGPTRIYIYIYIYIYSLPEFLLMSYNPYSSLQGPLLSFLSRLHMQTLKPSPDPQAAPSMPLWYHISGPIHLLPVPLQQPWLCDDH